MHEGAPMRDQSRDPFTTEGRQQPEEGVVTAKAVGVYGAAPVQGGIVQRPLTYLVRLLCFLFTHFNVPKAEFL